MSDNPCQKLLDEFKQATIDWQQATDAARTFAVSKPLSLDKDIELKPPEYYSQMQRAYEKEEIVRKIYFEKLHALQECQQKHKQ